MIAATNNTTKTIDAAVYKFGSDEVYGALKLALKRGVKVRIIADHSNNNATEHASKLKALGASVVLYKAGKLHAKLAIYDGTSYVAYFVGLASGHICDPHRDDCFCYFSSLLSSFFLCTSRCKRFDWFVQLVG